MQNQKDFFYHCNEIEYLLDFVIIFLKSDDALLKYVYLDNNVCLYEKDYYKFLFWSYIFD